MPMKSSDFVVHDAASLQANGPRLRQAGQRKKPVTNSSSLRPRIGKVCNAFSRIMNKSGHLWGIAFALIALRSNAADVLLTMDAYGPVRIGMDVREVRDKLKIMGRKNLPDPSRVARSGCDYYSPSRELSFMTSDRRIVRIETSEPNVVTPSGIRVGALASKARALFGSRLEDERQHYGHDKDRTLILVSGNGRFAMRFEADDRIGQIYAGFEHAIRFVEGCS